MIGASRSVDTHVVREMASFGASTVCEAAGGHGALKIPLIPLDSASVLAGPAHPVLSPPGDNLAIHRALARSEPGEILVVDAGAYMGTAHFGEIMAVAAKVRGVAGLVLDGAIRDAQAIAARGFPVFCRGFSPLGPTKLAPDEPVEELEMGNCRIRRGDLIVADRDGIVVVAAERVQDVLTAARQRTRREEELIAQLAEGRTTLELFGLQ